MRVFGEDEADEQLARYHELEHELERDGSRSYREVMTEAMRRSGHPRARRAGSPSRFRSWEPFPEVAGALAEARERGWKLAILSNCDTDLIAASKELIGVPFDEMVVASEIRSYKPAVLHWVEFYGRTLADKRRHVHVGASAYHDIAPAASGCGSRTSGSTASTSTLHRAHVELPDLTSWPTRSTSCSRASG